MNFRIPAYCAAIVVLCGAVSAAHAGIPLPPVFSYHLTGSPTQLVQNPLETKHFDTVPVGESSNGTTETVTVNVTGTPGSATASISAIATTGDFAVVGGTCVGATGLTNGSNCSLQLRFKPVAPGPRNGLLSITCDTVVAAPIGVLGLLCDSQQRDAYNLAGVGYLANAIPVLGREGMTLIALLLLGASFLALRRRR